MPRLRGSELPQRQSPRGPSQLRTSSSSSDSDPAHHRPITDKSPKLGDRRSPRGATPDSANQKKLGTRIADLESQLGQAQVELKSLKDQLATAEAGKKAAQEQLDKKAKKPAVSRPAEVRDKYSPPTEAKKTTKNDKISAAEFPDENQQAMDVFEVPVEKMTLEEPKVEHNQSNEEDEVNSKSIGLTTESPVEPEKPSFDELAMKNDEINLLKAKLEEKEKELEVSFQENESLKSKINEKDLEISAARAKEEELTLRLTQVGEELETCKSNAVQTTEKLEVCEKAKEELETEMKKLRVQTEQWRKAADAAAAVLSGGVEMNGRRLSERCGSMDKHFGSVFETPVGGYGNYVGSPGFGDDCDDGFGGGKRRGSGIRMFGDLWKKKGQK